MFDTREPVYATSFLLQTRRIRPQGNQISLEGHLQGECQLLLGLYCASQLLPQGFRAKNVHRFRPFRFKLFQAQERASVLFSSESARFSKSCNKVPYICADDPGWP